MQIKLDRDFLYIKYNFVHPVKLMKENEEFMERQIRFQLGSFYKSEDVKIPIDELSRLKKYPSHLFTIWNAGKNQVFPINQGQTNMAFLGGKWIAGSEKKTAKIVRSTRFLNEVRKFSKRGDYVFDFQDARWGNVCEIDDERLKPFPVFQYNRLKGDCSSILWPLARYHDIGKGNFPGNILHDSVSFSKKKPVVFWRGNLTGYCRLDNHSKIVGLRQLHDQIQSCKINDDEMLERLMTNSRFRAVSMFQNHDVVDARFVLTSMSESTLGRIPLVTQFVGNYVTRIEQMNYRYFLALEGHDCASSLYWMLATNSIVFKEDYEWESFPDCHLKPWEHYIPIAPDLSDLLDKYTWCERNKSECERIMSNAHSVCLKLGNRPLRDKILKQVIKRYEKSLDKNYSYQKSFKPMVEDCVSITEKYGSYKHSTNMDPYFQAIEMQILNRKKKLFSVASTEDFEVGSPKKIFLGNGAFNEITPYCFDYTNDNFVFVDNGKTSSDACFLYQGQYRSATKTILVKRNYLVNYLFSNKCSITLKPLIILSIGRCGSTLLSRLTNEAGYADYSEPDIFCLRDTKLNHLRFADILRCSVESMARHAGKESNSISIKLRSFSCRSAKYYIEALPESKFIFLVRNLTDWSRSFISKFNFTDERLYSTLRHGYTAHKILLNSKSNYTVMRYEDIVNNPTEQLKLLTCVHETQNSESIANCMKVDSQLDAGIKSRGMDAAELQSRVDGFLKYWRGCADAEMRSFYYESCDKKRL